MNKKSIVSLIKEIEGGFTEEENIADIYKFIKE